MITLISHPADRAFADRLTADLRAAGYTVFDSIQPGRGNVLVAIISPDALADDAFNHALQAANDLGQNMVGVQARPVAIPDDLDHVTLLDFETAYPLDELRAHVDALSGDKAPYPVRMQTPRVRASNRRAGVALGLLVLVMFVVASIAIILFDIESPQDEYDAVDTQVALTRDVYIQPTMQFLATVLPRNTEAAASFHETLEAVPTLVRPFLGGTATAMHEQLQQFAMTPNAAATPTASE